jgi:nicotinamidase-related amidase
MTAERMNAQASTLVLVDYQQRLMPLIDSHEAVLNEALRLADAASLLDVPIVGTQQNPAGLGHNDVRIRQRCASTLDKMHFDACEDGLVAALGERRDVVLAGCEAHVCLLQTGLGLLRAGRRVWVVAPACGSRLPTDRALALERLARAGAAIVSVEMVLFEWLHDCRHPQFKNVLAVIKRGPP